MMYSTTIDKDLPGKIIKQIFFNENYLRFVTNDKTFTYGVDGDCCSTSYFYDFHGVKKLLAGNPVTEVKECELEPSDIVEKKDPNYGWTSFTDKKSTDDSISVYGFQITTLDPEFGEVTSVFSFRNYSNGYYGGELINSNNQEFISPEIFDDVLETE